MFGIHRFSLVVALAALAAVPSAGAAESTGLSVGDVAPEVTLVNQDGQAVDLAALWSEAPLIVYFYPKDFTPSCTGEALDFRDAGPQLQAGGIRVVGISIDTVGSHRRFVSAYNLDFDVLSDVNARAADEFGVREESQGFVIARRSTFLIDQGGEIVTIWDPADPRDHATAVLAEARRQRLGAFETR